MRFTLWIMYTLPNNRFQKQNKSCVCEGTNAGKHIFFRFIHGKERDKDRES